MKLFFLASISIFFTHFCCYSQAGSLKNVIIEYDTTYECNNMHKGSSILEEYIENGLKLDVYDGPYLISQIIEKKDNINNGMYLSFYIPSNMPEKKGFFTSGDKDKNWYYWNAEGKLIKKEIWDKGRLLKTINIK